MYSRASWARVGLDTEHADMSAHLQAADEPGSLVLGVAVVHDVLRSDFVLGFTC